MANDEKIVTLKSSYTNDPIYPKTLISGVDGLEAELKKFKDDIDGIDTSIESIVKDKIDELAGDIIDNAKNQSDHVVQSWRQKDDPSGTENWKNDPTDGKWDPSTDYKKNHTGDLWYDTDDGATYQYAYNPNAKNDNEKYIWVQYDVPQDVWDEIDGKSTIYIKKPVKEGETKKIECSTDAFGQNKCFYSELQYHKGDMWIVCGADIYQPTIENPDTSATEKYIKARKNAFLVAINDASQMSNSELFIYSDADWKQKINYITPDEAVQAITTSDEWAELWTIVNKTKDKKIETYRSVGNPEKLNWYDASSNDIYDTEKLEGRANHIGDMWARLDPSNNNKILGTYMYVYSSGGDETGQAEPNDGINTKYDWIDYPLPEGLTDTIDGKCSVFMPIYDPSTKTWTGKPEYYTTGDLMIIPKYYTKLDDSIGKYTEEDWVVGELVIANTGTTRREKFLWSDWYQKIYTATPDLYKEFHDAYRGYLDIISKQTYKAAHLWYQKNDPANNWNTDTEKAEHVGDLWYDNDAQNDQLQIFGINHTWEILSAIPSELFDRVDGDASIYVTAPTNCSKNDVLILKENVIVDGSTVGSNSTIYIALNDISNGNSSTKAYWDNWLDVLLKVTPENFKEFLSVYEDYIGQLGSDGRAQIWTQANDPSDEWPTPEEKAKHIGDIWNNTGKYNASSNPNGGKSAIYMQPSEGIFAWDWNFVLPQQFIDKVDGTNQIFDCKPWDTSMYYARDLWIVNASDNSIYYNISTNKVISASTYNDPSTNRGEYKDVYPGTILTADNDKKSSFEYSDWEKKIQYIDSSTWGNEFNNFSTEIKNQIDQSVTTWKYEYAPNLIDGDTSMARPWINSNNPNENGLDFSHDNEHLCDLWINTSKNMSYMLAGNVATGFNWVEYDLPDVVEKKITDRARIWMPSSDTDAPFNIIKDNGTSTIKIGDMIMPTTEIEYTYKTPVGNKAKEHFPNKVYTWDGSAFIEINYTDDSGLNNFKDDLADGNVITKGEKADYVRRIKQITNQEKLGEFISHAAEITIDDLPKIIDIEFTSNGTDDMSGLNGTWRTSDGYIFKPVSVYDDQFIDGYHAAEITLHSNNIDLSYSTIKLNEDYNGYFSADGVENSCKFKITKKYEYEYDLNTKIIKIPTIQNSPNAEDKDIRGVKFIIDSSINSDNELYINLKFNNINDVSTYIKTLESSDSVDITNIKDDEYITSDVNKLYLNNKYNNYYIGTVYENKIDKEYTSFGFVSDKWCLNIKDNCIIYIGDFLTGSFHDTYLKLISTSRYDEARNLKNLLLNLLELVAPDDNDNIFDNTKDWNYNTEYKDKDYNHQQEIENAFKAYFDYEAICNGNISNDLNYLKDIFNNDVDESGVTLSNLLAVKDNETKNVVAGIYGGNVEDLDNNGFKDDEHGALMMFAGAENLDNVENAKVKIYEDGHAAFRDVEVVGGTNSKNKILINNDNDDVAGMYIYNDSQCIAKFTSGKVPTFTGAATNNSVEVEGINNTSVWNSNTASSSVINIDKEITLIGTENHKITNGTFKIIFNDDEGNLSNFDDLSITVKIDTKEYKINYDNTTESLDLFYCLKDQEFKNGKKIKFKITINGEYLGEKPSVGNIYINIINIKSTQDKYISEYGSNGLTLSINSDNYFNVSINEDNSLYIRIQCGDNYLSIDNSGIIISGNITINDNTTN